MNPTITIPRAAVAVALRCCCYYRHGGTTIIGTNKNNNNSYARPLTAASQQQQQQQLQYYYALVQRGNEPNKGIWSLPGGKIDYGEGTLDAAKRELFEETRLGGGLVGGGDISASTNRPLGDYYDDNDTIPYILKWYSSGPFMSTDSIHFDDHHYDKKIIDGGSKDDDDIIKRRNKRIRFHYVISQCFAEVVIIDESKTTTTTTTTTTNILPHLPRLIASDDAMDAKWWTIDELEKGINEGLVNEGVKRVINRAEELYDNGLLVCDV